MVETMSVKMLSAGRQQRGELSASCVGRTSGEKMEKPVALQGPPGEDVGRSWDSYGESVVPSLTSSPLGAGTNTWSL